MKSKDLLNCSGIAAGIGSGSCLLAIGLTPEFRHLAEQGGFTCLATIGILGVVIGIASTKKLITEHLRSKTLGNTPKDSYNTPYK